MIDAILRWKAEIRSLLPNIVCCSRNRADMKVTGKPKYKAEHYVAGHRSELLVVMLYFIFLFLLCLNTVVSIFPPPLSPALPTPTSPHQSHPRLGSINGSLIHVHLCPLPFFPTNFPFPSPLVTISLLSISMSLTIFCLPVCFVN